MESLMDIALGRGQAENTPTEGVEIEKTMSKLQ